MHVDDFMWCNLVWCGLMWDGVGWGVDVFMWVGWSGVAWGEARLRSQCDDL